MTLIRYRPSRELSSLQGDFNRLFNSLLGDVSTDDNRGFRRWTPAVDLVETEDHFVLTADLPGLAEDDISVELQDNVLTVAGERRSEHEERREGLHRVERASGRFARRLRLPEGVDAEAVEASFDRGVLEVRVPKPQERRPHRVSIAVGGPRPTIEASESGSDDVPASGDRPAAA